MLLGREIWTHSASANRSEGPFSQRVTCRGVGGGVWLGVGPSMVFPPDALQLEGVHVNPSTEGTVGPSPD